MTETTIQFAFEVLGAPFKGEYVPAPATSPKDPATSPKATEAGRLRIEGDLGPLPYSIQARGVRAALRDLVDRSAWNREAWLEVTPARHIQLVGETTAPIASDSDLVAALARLAAAARPQLIEAGGLLGQSAA